MLDDCSGDSSPTRARIGRLILRIESEQLRSFAYSAFLYSLTGHMEPCASYFRAKLVRYLTVPVNFTLFLRVRPREVGDR